jgi:hypothetical protein
MSRQFGRTVPVPRMEVCIAERPYRYSGRVYQPFPWTSALLEIKQAVAYADGVETSTAEGEGVVRLPDQFDVSDGTVAAGMSSAGSSRMELIIHDAPEKS